MPVDTWRHTGPVDFAGNPATDLATPVNAQDAATKAWTEALVAALAATCATDAELSAALAALAVTLAPLSHTHAQADVTGLTADLAAKAAAVHTHAIADVTGLTAALTGKADSAHTHSQADIVGLTAALAAKAALAHTHAQADVTGLVAALAAKADSVHTHAIGDVTGLTAALAGKADTSHSHALADVTGLVAALAGKADSVHGHALADVTGLVAALAAKADASAVVASFNGATGAVLFARGPLTLYPFGPDQLLTTGDGKVYWPVPPEFHGKSVAWVSMYAPTPASAGTPTYQLARIRAGVAVDVLSTPVSLDATEQFSYQAATPAVVDGANNGLQSSGAGVDVLRVDCDVAGTGTKGATLQIGFTA